MEENPIGPQRETIHAANNVIHVKRRVQSNRRKIPSKARHLMTGTGALRRAFRSGKVHTAAGARSRRTYDAMLQRRFSS